MGACGCCPRAQRAGSVRGLRARSSTGEVAEAIGREVELGRLLTKLSHETDPVRGGRVLSML